MHRLIALLLMLLFLPACAIADFDFPGIFLEDGQAIIHTEDTYRSQNLAITLTSQRIEECDVYVADVYVRSLEQLQRYFADDVWNKRADRMRTMAPESGAILAITGDNSRLISAGYVFGNGKLLRQTKNTKRDLCVIYKTGEMQVLTAGHIDHDLLLAQADDIWHSFLFGPSLLDASGKAMTEFISTVKVANPRSAIGYYEPGHYCLVQVDGRGTQSALEERHISTGMTLTQLSSLMESLGCKAAYNLDGGQSSMLWWNGDVFSTPYRGGRPLGDIIILTEPSAQAE